MAKDSDEWLAITYRNGPVELCCGCTLLVRKKDVQIVRSCWVLRRLVIENPFEDVTPEEIAQTHAALHCTMGRYQEWSKLKE